MSRDSNSNKLQANASTQTDVPACCGSLIFALQQELASVKLRLQESLQLSQQETCGDPEPVGLPALPEWNRQLPTPGLGEEVAVSPVCVGSQLQTVLTHHPLGVVKEELLDDTLHASEVATEPTDAEITHSEMCDLQFSTTPKLATESLLALAESGNASSASQASNTVNRPCSPHLPNLSQIVACHLPSEAQYLKKEGVNIIEFHAVDTDSLVDGENSEASVGVATGSGVQQSRSKIQLRTSNALQGDGSSVTTDSGECKFGHGVLVKDSEEAVVRLCVSFADLQSSAAAFVCQCCLNDSPSNGAIEPSFTEASSAPNVAADDSITSHLCYPYQCNPLTSSEPDRPRGCRQCGQRFSTLQRMREHHCSPGSWPCGRCGVSFGRLPNLRRHESTVHAAERLHRCCTCGRTFAEQRNLQAHLLTHTGERPYECSVCSHTFRQQSALSRHRRSHTWQWPHCCTDCGRGFSLSSGLIRHRRSAHRDLPTGLT